MDERKVVSLKEAKKRGKASQPPRAAPQAPLRNPPAKQVKLVHKAARVVQVLIFLLLVFMLVRLCRG